MRATWIVAAALALPVVAHGQDAPAAPAPAGDAAHAQVLATIDLPQRAQALRDDGVPADQVKEALDASQKKGLHASDASGVLDEADKAVKANGPVDNFGAFVSAQLDAGLRGKDLAAAIKAEHEAHGKKAGQGKPEGAGKEGAGKPEGAGKEGAGKPEGAGKEGAGKPQSTGKPESTGKPAASGAPSDKPTVTGKPTETARPSGPAASGGPASPKAPASGKPPQKGN